jgi:LacI family transcriptional regulator
MKGVNQAGVVRIFLVVSLVQEHFRRVVVGCRQLVEDHALDWELMDRWTEEADAQVLAMADGVILQGGEPAMIEEIRRRGLPVVRVGGREEPEPGIVQVTVDNQAVGARAAEHFLERGFRDFAFWGVKNHYFSQQRGAGFVDALGRREVRIWEQEPSPEMLAKLPVGTGLFCTNDIRARKAVIALRKAGRLVPEEVAVVGADDDPLESALSPVPLSSVRTRGEILGLVAAAELEKQFRGQRTKPGERREIFIEPGEVVVRRSSDVERIEDPALAGALAWIREEAENPALHPSEVVHRAGVSRRALERRFQKELGRGIEAEIRRVRIERAKRLLEGTRMSIGEVSDRSGFRDVYHFSRVFKQTTGKSPREWRMHVAHRG